jgi:hypothetical protein
MHDWRALSLLLGTSKPGPGTIPGPGDERYTYFQLSFSVTEPDEGVV